MDANLEFLNRECLFVKKRLKISTYLHLIDFFLTLVISFYLAKFLHALIILNQSFRTNSQLFFIFFSLGISKFIVIYLANTLSARAALLVKKNIQNKLLDKLKKINLFTFEKNSPAKLQNIFYDNLEKINAFVINYQIDKVKVRYMCSFLIIFAFYLDLVVGFIFFLSLPLLPVFMILVGRKTKDISLENVQKLKQLSELFLDRVKASDTILLFSLKKTQQEEVKKSSENFAKKTMQILRIAFLNSAILEFFASLLIAIVAVYFGFSFLDEIRLGPKPDLFLGMFLLMLAPIFYMPLRELGASYHAKSDALAACEHVREFLNLTEKKSKKIKKEQNNSKFLLDVENVSVIRNNKTILEKINLEAKSNEKIAIIGKSGSGKTTLLNAIANLVDFKGDIYLNQQNKSNNIAYLLQTPLLQTASLKENITLGLKENIPFEKVKDVLIKANLREFATKKILNKKIAEFGRNLSLGQIQRIAFARMLLRPNPELALFDEPSANLDKMSKQKIFNTLLDEFSKTTCLIVTHDIEFLQKMDRIILLDKGKVLSQGKFQQLKNNKTFLQMLKIWQENLYD